MSLAQVIEELPRFTVVERQELLRNVLELDDEGRSDSELALVDQRLAAYQTDPARVVPVETMAERISHEIFPVNWKVVVLPEFYSDLEEAGGRINHRVHRDHGE